MTRVMFRVTMITDNESIISFQSIHLAIRIMKGSETRNRRFYSVTVQRLIIVIGVLRFNTELAT